MGYLRMASDTATIHVHRKGMEGGDAEWSDRSVLDDGRLQAGHSGPSGAVRQGQSKGRPQRDSRKLVARGQQASCMHREPREQIPHGHMRCFSGPTTYRNPFSTSG